MTPNVNLNTLSELQHVKGLKIIHMNIRSLLPKIDQIRTLLINSKIDIIILSETWLNASIDSQMVNIPGYSLIRHDRSFGSKSKTKRGGGLSIYINEALSSDLKILKDLNSSNKNLESLWLKIQRKQAKNIILSAVYRPPNGKVNKAINYLNSSLNKIEQLNKNDVYIVGDLNIDYKNRKSVAHRKLAFFVRANGFKQIIKNTTRNTSSSSTILDLIITNAQYISSSGTINSYISDHQPIYIVKKKEKQITISCEFKGRSYRKYNEEEFKESLSQCNWEGFFNEPDLNLAWKLMLDRITEEVDKQCPMRSFHIQNYKPSWITDELIEQGKDRDYFYKKAKRTKDEDDWNIAKHLRNLTNRNFRQAKAEYIKSQLESNSDNSSKFWRTIKSIFPSKKGAQTCRNITLKNEDGTQINDTNIANFVNNFFINVGKIKTKRSNNNINGNEQSSDGSANMENISVPSAGNTKLDKRIDLQTPPASDQIPSNFENKTTEGQLDYAELGNAELDHELNTAIIQHISEESVIELLRKVNVSKSSGMTNLSARLVKDALVALSKEFTFLLNRSLELGQFPDAWKMATVTPIPKSGDLTQISNYRPISLLPLPGKIMEKIIHKQLMDFIEVNDILSDSQYGFRKERSTVQAVHNLTEEINIAFNKSLFSVAIYIDFKKAFDCVQYPVLLQKLKNIDLSITALNWLESYLDNRQQRTVVNGKYSSYSLITQGVPQGSILGPLLYIIYANDIATKITKSKSIFYADDTVLFTHGKNIDEIEKSLQIDLDSLNSWCSDNGLFINSKKTKYMVFGSKSKLADARDLSLTIENTNLERAVNYTYLGITLDEQLNYEQHAGNTIRRVSDKIYQLRKLRSFLNNKAALLVYKNMILPILEYGDVFFSSTILKTRKKLQTLQNQGLKCALNKDRLFNTNLLHSEAKLQKLKWRRKQHIGQLVFQTTKLKNFKNWKPKLCNMTTRSSKKKLITSRKPNNEKFKKSITYFGTKLWNSLPAELQKESEYPIFKHKLKLHINSLETKSHPE